MELLNRYLYLSVSLNSIHPRINKNLKLQMSLERNSLENDHNFHIPTPCYALLPKQFQYSSDIFLALFMSVKSKPSCKTSNVGQSLKIINLLFSVQR